MPWLKAIKLAYFRRANLDVPIWTCRSRRADLDLRIFDLPPPFAISDDCASGWIKIG
jgi:hypothetical protein